jgi:hypothetical protein
MSLKKDGGVAVSKKTKDKKPEVLKVIPQRKKDIKADSLRGKLIQHITRHI